MTSCCGIGALSALSIGQSGGTLSRMDFIEFTPTKIIKTLSDGSRNTIRGTFAHNSISATEGLAFVEFRVSMYMTAAKMDILLPLMGLIETPTDTFTIATTSANIATATAIEAKVIVTPNGGKDHTFDNAKVARWVIHGRKGTDPVRIDIDFVAKSWAEAASGTYTHGTIVEGYPYGFTQGSMTLEGATRYFNQVRLGMDYGLLVESNNSIYPTNLCWSDYNLNFGTGVLLSVCDSTTDLYTVPMTSATAATGSQLTLGWTRTVGAATYSTSFVVGNVKLLPRFPGIKKNDFNRLPVFGTGFEVTGGAGLLVCTNDASA